MMKKIKNKLFDKTWKRALFTFIVIFLFVFMTGVTSINYLNDVVNNSHIYPEIVTVSDKMYSDKMITDRYVIVGTNNKTYSIANYNDNYGNKMFEKMDIGGTYEFIVREPSLTDLNQNTHILQVHNVTGSSL